MPDNYKPHSKSKNWTDSLAGQTVDRANFDRRTFLRSSGFAAALSALGGFSPTTARAASQPSDGKTRVTIYTEQERQNARENIQNFDWAKEQRDNAVSNADAALEAYTKEELWNLISSQDIPRSYQLGPGITYPGDWGGKYTLDAYGDTPQPPLRWKVTDGEWTLPTNDFEAYRQSGLDSEGKFDPTLADDSLLVNELYPDQPDDFGVDDGTGFTDERGILGEEGGRWTPVAWFNHWNIAYGFRGMLVALRDAYLFTGEQKYATAGSIILDRFADVYPEMSLLDTVYYEEGGYTYLNGYRNSHGGTGNGKIIGSIFESYWIKAVLRSYDAFFPALENNEELVSFLSDKANTYDLGDKSSVEQIRENIESGLVKQVLPAVKKAQIRGNFGSHQATLAISAVVQDDPEGYTGDAIDFAFQAGDLKYENNGTPWGRWYLTGGAILSTLVGTVDRNGHADESSVHYNSDVVTAAIQSVADVLNGYDAYEGADLYRNVKFKRMLYAHYPLVMLDDYIPSIGDTEPSGKPGFDWIIDANNITTAYQEYQDPVLAQWAYKLNGSSVEGLQGNIFGENPTELGKEIQSVIDAEGPLDLNSTNLPGYGFTALRDDSGDVERGVWMYYGRNAFGEEYGTSHTHNDTLNIGLYAHKLDLTPELGYPDSGHDAWAQGTISHNTVMVDDEHHDPIWVGTPRHFDQTDQVQVMDVEAPNAYEQAEAYRRTTAMIEVDDENSYAVDFFRVDGGADHRFSFHGMTEEATTSGLDLVAQDGGTYAGSGVPFESDEYAENHENAFNHLENVTRDDDPGERFSVDWDIQDYWNAREDDADVRLRLTMLEGMDNVALADGHPPQEHIDNPDTYRYMIAHRTGSDLDTTFTSVLEPYVESRFVESTSALPVKGENPGSVRAVKVELANGRTDYVVSSLDRENTYTVDGVLKFRGSFAVYAERDGEHEFVYADDTEFLRTIGSSARRRGGHGPPLVQHETSRFTGTVEDFTRELSMENELTVSVDEAPQDIGLEEMIGEWVWVQTDNRRNGVYEINGVASGEGDRMILDIGEQTTVREFVDPKDTDAGYRYLVSEGAPFYIPISES